MTDVHQQIDHLKCQIDTGAEETKVYLDKLKKKVEEFDAQHKLSETATSYLKSGIDSTRASVDELKHVGAQLQQQSAHASRQSIDTAQHALCQVKDSLHELQCKANEYDRKFAGSMGGRVSEGIESVVNAARQRTTDAIEMANEQAMRVKEMLQNVASGATHTAQVATGEVVKAAAIVDEKLGVTPKVASAVGGVTETVKNLDKRMHVTETAVKIDEKITGGLGSKVIHKGVEMVQESIEYVTETLHQAKLAANKSPAAQAVEERASGVAQQASETAGMVQDKAIAAKEQAQATASSAQQKVMETAGAAKEKVMGSPMMQHGQEMAGSAMEKGQQLKEGAQHKGQEYMDVAKQKGSEAMEGGQQMKEGAKQKGSEAMEGVKQKGSEAMDKGQQMKEGVKQKGSEAMEGAKQKGSEAMEKGQHMKEGVKQKGSEAMEKGKQAMGGGSSSTSTTGSSGGSTMASMKEKATDLGTAAKEATMGMSSGESATDVRHKQPSGTSGDEGLMQQTVASAKHTAEQAKEKMADTMSRQKGIMKDATKM